MNGLSIRVREPCTPECHENAGLRSRKNMFDGVLLSRLAIAVAIWAGPKPMQTRSYIVVAESEPEECCRWFFDRSVEAITLTISIQKGFGRRDLEVRYEARTESATVHRTVMDQPPKLVPRLQDPTHGRQ